MDTNKEKQLLELLNEFFTTTDFNNPRVWKRNEIARQLKQNITELGHWKELPRGNPKEGYKYGEHIKAYKNGLIDKKLTFEEFKNLNNNDW